MQAYADFKSCLHEVYCLYASACALQRMMLEPQLLEGKKKKQNEEKEDISACMVQACIENARHLLDSLMHKVGCICICFINA